MKKKKQQDNTPSYMKMRLMWLAFRFGKKYGFQPVYQEAMIDFMSVGQFKLFMKYFPFVKEEHQKKLLEPQNADKFKVYTENGGSVSLEVLVLTHGSREQIKFYLERQTLAKRNEPFLLTEKGRLFFDFYVQNHSLSEMTLLQIIAGNREDLLLEYMRQRTENFTAALQLDLFQSNCKQAQKLYIEKSTFFCPEVRLIILRRGEIAAIRKLMQYYLLQEPDELEALFDLQNEELLRLYLKSLYACETHDSQGKIIPVLIPGDFDSRLIDFGSSELIRQYLPGRHLSIPAEENLARLNEPELLSLYLTQGRLDYNGDPRLSATAEKILFNSAMDEVKAFYEQQYGLPYMLEAQLVCGTDQEKIVSYTKERQLRSLNAARLVEFAATETIKAYLAKYELSSLAETVLMKRGNAEARDFYANKLITNGKRLNHDAEAYFMANGAKETVERYVLEGKEDICTQAVVFLLDRGDIDLSKAYINEFGINSAEQALFVQHGKNESIIALIQAFSLSSDGERVLIKRGDNGLLKAYFQLYRLEPDTELELIQSDNAAINEAVCFYLEEFQLSDDAEMALVKSGRRDWLDIYIAKHELLKEAEELIIQIF